MEYCPRTSQFLLPEFYFDNFVLRKILANFFTEVFCFAIIWPGVAKMKAKWILAGVIALYVIFTGVGNINPDFTGVRTLG